MNRPAGAVAIMAPDSTLGKLIAKRSGVDFSHVAIALGNGNTLDSTSPWTRITTEDYWKNSKRYIEWYAPVVEFSEEETRLLKSIAKMIEGRIRYGYADLAEFLIKGVPGKRGHYLFCTYLVAEMYMVIRNLDLSGCEQPWNMDIRETLQALRTSGHFVRMLQ